MTASAAPPGFEWVRSRGATFLVRCDAREWLVPLLERPNSQLRDTDFSPAGRGGTRLAENGGHRIVIRSYRRGGVPALFLRDLYLGIHPRPFRELCVMEMLRRQGAPVVAAYGALVRWVVPGCYRGWLATRYVSGARTLWQWACAAVNEPQRAAVFRRAGSALRRLHSCGARHPDLNANNILICPSHDGAVVPEVLFIDFDRARPRVPCASEALADLARLRRSVRKLDPAGTRISATDLAILESAYRESPV